MRARALVVSLVAAALAAPAFAAGATELRRPDVSRYPVIEVTAVTGAPQARPPALRENGRPVAGLVAENLGRSKNVVVAVDRSRSMVDGALADAVEAARSFVAAKAPGDRVAVVAFGSRAIQLSRFSSATIDADIALGTLALDGTQGTALNDAVVLASRALAQEPGAARVLVVLTDGTDVSSAASAADAVAAATEAGVAVYAIGIESDQFAPETLRALAEATGGSYHGVASTDALVDVYADVAAELARTWRLSYVSAARPGERLVLEAGGGSATVRAPGVAPAREGDAAVGPGHVYTSRWAPFALAGLVGGLLLAAAALLARANRSSWLRGRLAAHVEPSRRERRATAAQERFAARSALMQSTESAFGHLRFWKRTHALIERADVPLRTVEFLYLSLGTGLAAGLLAALAARPSVVVVAAMAGGAALPFGYLSFRAGRRTRAFENQLPDLLLTLAASLKAGHSFKQGLQSVVDEGEPPASKEFKRVLTEAQLGRPMDEALAEMGARVRSRNLDFVITSVTIQGQVGGSLAGLFDMVAEAVRQRQQFARKVRGLTAMGRASGYVLVGLPFFIAGAVTLLNREYMDPLYHTSQGHVMIGVSLVMIAFGSLILKKIVSFRG